LVDLGQREKLVGRIGGAVKNLGKNFSAVVLNPVKDPSELHSRELISTHSRVHIQTPPPSPNQSPADGLLQNFLLFISSLKSQELFMCLDLPVGMHSCFKNTRLNNEKYVLSPHTFGCGRSVNRAIRTFCFACYSAA
jgi:hypothetical protein